MKILHRKLKCKSKYNYLKIETSGLSRDKDQIISIGFVLENHDEIINYSIENLKEEETIIEEFSKIFTGKEFITFSGKSFDIPFINEKYEFYFGDNIDIKTIDLQNLVKKYNYIFNLDSFSNNNLLLNFGIINKDKLIKGIKNHIYFKNFVEGKSENLDKVIENNFNSIENLIALHERILSQLEDKLSFEIDDYKFIIKDIKLIGNTLEIVGTSNIIEEYYVTNKLYTLDLGNKFISRINTNDLPYDKDNNCYFVMRSDFGNLKNKSELKSPEKILILYYKDHIFENVKELLEFIIRIEICNIGAVTE